MGKTTGFLEYDRKEQNKRDPEDRIQDWNEFRIPLSKEEMQVQGARCMDCGIPFCHGGVLLAGMAAGCPVKNLIPEWNDLVYRNQWEEAYKRLERTNPFPEFTSRVCPAPCEGSCTEGYQMESVTISNIEYEIIETAFRNGWVGPATPKRTGKKVAIVGSGPAGLSTAYYLNAVGHRVTVFERNDRPGGLLMYGIPNMKLEKQIVERRIRIMEEAGIDFALNCEIGKTKSAASLVEEFDAVVLCCGATKARGLQVEGADLKGVHYAVDFLTANTKSLLDSNFQDGKYIDPKGKDVLVIGGGDTGTDCVGTAIRHGCNSVYQFEIMPKPADKRDPETNPWPEWPKKQKMDYGQEEAAALYGDDPRQYLINTKRIVGDDLGNVKEVHTVQIEWKKNPAGSMVPVEVEGSEKVWKADLVLMAMGFLGPEDTLVEALHLKRDGRSNILAAYGDFETSEEKVFTAGDARRGQSLVVWAIQEGKLAAKEVDVYLTGKSMIK
ncbi:glutamate synthase subunit beta [Alkalibacter rhizosphaerae]|uniref:Glutamate synthase subunit beta n=1 Tax=Alkalibacter rhizosphaerae TaxID=2815577 RepID=A0A975AIX1_9FIRM|nr:glutamate synthase subunit beta [Alkalibacter rhizosphaerae]QSX08980.1 glutamate synthase subunit beta [Alkalibacter rhizosphaerae]